MKITMCDVCGKAVGKFRGEIDQDVFISYSGKRTVARVSIKTSEFMDLCKVCFSTATLAALEEREEESNGDI